MKDAARRDGGVSFKPVENCPFPWDRRRRVGDLLEAHIAQHGLDTTPVRTPPTAWIVLQLGAGVENHRRARDLRRVKDRLQD